MTIDIEKLTIAHTKALELLEAIREVRKRHESKKQGMDSCTVIFPQMRKKYLSDLDTLQRVEKRLIKKYYENI
jgi:hypothetical protein